MVMFRRGAVPSVASFPSMMASMAFYNQYEGLTFLLLLLQICRSSEVFRSSLLQHGLQWR